MRIVLDTASFIAALRSRVGAARQIVLMILQQDLLLLMDLKLGLEYRDVALRAQHVDASSWSRAEILELIYDLETVAEAVEVTAQVRPFSADPNDDMVIDVALNGRAEVIVTTNTRHFTGVASKFKIDVLTPGELLERLRREQDVN